MSAADPLVCACGDDEHQHVHRAGACKRPGCDCMKFVALGSGPYFRGGPKRSTIGMTRALAALRDEGGLPSDAALIFSQLLLNLAGYRGRTGAERLIREFLDAADVVDH